MYVNGRLKLFRHLFHSAVQQTLRPVVLQIQKLFKNMTPTQQFFQLVGSRRRYLKYVTLRIKLPSSSCSYKLCHENRIFESGRNGANLIC